jgi:calcium-independent phospholipase A2
MAGLFNSVVSLGKTALGKIQGSSDPNVVKAVNPTEFATVPTQDREDCLMLYGPRTVTVKKEVIQLFDIVVLSDKNHSTAFSLCRCLNKEDAKERFELYKFHIPIIMSIDQDLCNLSTLQQICDALKENRSLNNAHLSVQLDLKNVLAHADIEPMFNEQEKDGLTPMMIAVKKQNVYAVRYLMTKKVDLSKVDGKKNNVFHYAATAGKDIIDALGAERPDLLKVCNSEGFTPLHIACHQDMPDCVQALLCAGADVNTAATIDSAETPLSPTSTGKGLKEIIQQFPKQLHTQVGELVTIILKFKFKFGNSELSKLSHTTSIATSFRNIWNRAFRITVNKTEKSLSNIAVTHLYCKEVNISQEVLMV